MKLTLDRVPSTLGGAVDLLFESLEEQDREFIRGNPEVSVHHTNGRWLRNNWSLWEKDKPLPTWFRENLGLGHADDMSSIILSSLWARVRGEEFDLDSQVRRFKAHWRRFGVDPRTQETVE